MIKSSKPKNKKTQKNKHDRNCIAEHLLIPRGILSSDRFE